MGLAERVISMTPISSLQDQLVSVQQSYIEAMQEAAETYGIGTDEYTKAVEAIC